MSGWMVYFDEPVRYRDGVALQERLLAARIADAIPDTVLLLQHPPTVTVGNRGRMNHLQLPPEEYARRGIDLEFASRGGDVTYHGPGQWVLYPIIQLGTRGEDAHGYLHNLEEVAIRTAGDFGVTAFRREKMNGAWTDAGKIAAIGFRLRRWVSMHGMSFNVRMDLAGFQTIVPCGLAGQPVASLADAQGARCPELAAVRARLAANFMSVCGRNLDPLSSPAAATGVLRGLLQH